MISALQAMPLKIERFEPAQVQWRDDPDAFQRWKDGRTGLPLVDANMREMAQTGARSHLPET